MLYSVSIDTFKDQAESQSYSARIRQAVDQLVRRYGVTNKSILSLGSRFGREEYWLAKLGGNRVMLLDIDEQNDLQPILQRAEPGDLRYFIGDAAHLPGDEEFDVLFLSGFAPDEFYRAAILKDHNGIWPAGAKPFCDLTVRFAGRLRPGGLLIIQSFYSGVDCDVSPDYIPSCDAQLRAIGLDLVEHYRFSYSHGINLFVITKGDAGFTLDCDISIFHGRGLIEPAEAIRTIHERTAPISSTDKASDAAKA